MPRLRNRATRRLGAASDIGVTLALLIGPIEGRGLTREELALAWELRGEEIMRNGHGLPGTRPWGFWQFEIGEDAPRGSAAQTVRLAELGLLTPEEVSRLEERANEARLRVGTAHERIAGGNRETGVSLDVADVELWEAAKGAVSS